MPLFEGENPDEWIFRAERYFAVNQLADEEKIESAALCFEAAALAWFQWESRRNGFRSWDTLKRGLRERFRSSQEGTVEERLLALRQEGSVRDYRLMFEMLAAPVVDVPESILEGQFINGLKPEIRAELRVLRPRGLDRIMGLAQSIEEKNIALHGCSKVIGLAKGSYHYTPPTATRSTSMPGRIQLTPPRPSQHLFGPRTAVPSSGSAPVKRLSEAEWKAKREKGLCFRCDEKYTIGHRCKNRELQVLMVHDEEMEDEGWDDERIPKEEGGYEPGEEVVELSMNSVVGLTAPQTMKLRGDIKGHPVVVLIDGGATHNFIATELVQ